MEPIDKNQLLNDAYQYLQGQSLGIISSVASDNTPESACVNYMLDSDWTLYVITKNDSRKAQNIQKNNHVAFVVGVAQIPNTVQIQADAQIIDTDNELYEPTFAKIKASKRLDRDPMYDMFSNDYIILKLKITWLRWLYFDKTNGKHVYTVLIP